jgi:simple sugar transport system permease protein
MTEKKSFKEKLTAFFKKDGTVSLLSSLISILMGIFIGFIVMVVISIIDKNNDVSSAFKGLRYIFLGPLGAKTTANVLSNTGNMIFYSVPLIFTGLSVAIAYKTGLFNIGASGQYCVGAGISIYAAVAWHLPWILCLLLACAAGVLWGAIVGFLKAYRNVNEVISGIMLNWIALYLVNMLTADIRNGGEPYTKAIATESAGSVLPSLGLDKFFGAANAGIAIPLAVIFAILVWFIQSKTVFGYELRATGFNKEAARYAGMKEKQNIVLTIMIGGGLSGLGAGMYYLTSMEPWCVTSTAVPDMGFSGIAATFLGGLHPIGTVVASYLLTHIKQGGASIVSNGYPAQISDLISALIIYLC